MRPLELAFLISEMSYVLWLLFGTGLPDSPFKWLAFVAAGVALAQVKFEGFRWHMIPGYSLLIFILASYPWYSAHDFRMRLTSAALVVAFSGVAIGASGLLAGVLYPVFSFAPLTGRYRVGTFAMALVDTKRIDPYAPDGAKPRELMVQFWYPAEAAKPAIRARYRGGRRGDWRECNLPLVKARSFLNAPISREQEALPVLLFTGPNNRFQNTFETEELASHGYLVVALDHPHDSDVVAFPDGHMATRRKGNIFLDFRTDETLESSIRDVTAKLAVQVANVEFVVKHLEDWETHHPENQLSGHIDTSRIGIFGHSFGGAVAAEVCARNAKLQAGINMDGCLFGQARTGGVRAPFFFMVDSTPKPTNAELQALKGEKRRSAERSLQGYEEIEHSLRLHGGYYLQTAGMEHMNYSDYPLFSQVKARTGAGSIDIRRAHLMINTFSVAFFNTYLLKSSEDILLSAAGRFSEAHFRRVDRAASAGQSARVESVGSL
jgi:dienelactone hydrolase